MRKHKATLILAFLLATFHLLLVVPCTTPLFHSGNSCGGGQSIILVAISDYPLVALTETLPHSRSVFYDPLTKYMQFFWWGGTLMYAGIGALIGWTIDAIIAWLLKPVPISN